MREDLAPYVGVTGFTNRKQVEDALLAFTHTSRRLMVGVLASYKSLRGMPLKPKWAVQTPHADTLAELFVLYNRALNLVHYAADRVDLAHLADDLALVAQYAGLCLDGFQLNVPWPDPDVLRWCRKTRTSFPIPPRFVLQVSVEAVAEAGGTMEGVASRLAAYEGLADYALFDASGGQGKPLDAERALAFLRACDGSLVRLGVAGGLGADSLSLIMPVLAEFPFTSFDAQGKLQGKNGLDVAKMERYLARAATLVR